MSSFFIRRDDSQVLSIIPMGNVEQVMEALNKDPHLFLDFGEGYTTRRAVCPTCLLSSEEKNWAGKTSTATMCPECGAPVQPLVPLITDHDTSNLVAELIDHKLTHYFDTQVSIPVEVVGVIMTPIDLAFATEETHSNSTHQVGIVYQLSRGGKYTAFNIQVRSSDTRLMLLTDFVDAIPKGKSFESLSDAVHYLHQQNGTEFVLV